MARIGQTYFYNAHVRRMLSVFSYVFSDIKIAKFNQDGSIKDVSKAIPIRFANGDSDVLLNSRNVNSREKEGISSGFQETFPRMVYSLTSMAYDPSRQHSPKNTYRTPTDSGVKTITEAVNYTMGISLEIVTKNMFDAQQIFEQIVPHFCPSKNISIKDYPAEDCHLDIPITLVSTSFDDNYSDYADDKRRVIFTLDFELSIRLYGATGQGIETNALLFQIAQAVGCEASELNSNDFSNLRKTVDSDTKKLIDAYNTRIIDNGENGTIKLRFRGVENNILRTELGDWCYEPELEEIEFDEETADFYINSKSNI